MTRHGALPRHARKVALLALTVALSGCIAGPGDPEELDAANFTLTTDRTEYTAISLGGEGPYREYAFTVLAKFRNNSEHTVYLARCMPDSPSPMYGVGMVVGDGGWGSAYNGAWGCAGHDRQFAVRPGQTRTDVFRIRGPNTWDGRTNEPHGTLTGQMRIGYSVQACRDCSAAVTRTSNAFTVSVLP